MKPLEPWLPCSQTSRQPCLEDFGAPNYINTKTHRLSPRLKGLCNNEETVAPVPPCHAHSCHSPQQRTWGSLMPNVLNLISEISNSLLLSTSPQLTNSTRTQFSRRLCALNYLKSVAFPLLRAWPVQGRINIPGIVHRWPLSLELNAASLAQARGACVSLTTV